MLLSLVINGVGCKYDNEENKTKQDHSNLLENSGKCPL